ncbi:MAG: TIGR03790 family protein [Nitrosomonas sp.]|nr:MAG: TIGR03790 family protein [Nitrosomonas sp.]
MEKNSVLRLITMLVLLFATCTAYAVERIALPKTGLTPDEVALIINDDDPLSQQIGDYYRQARDIPIANVVRVRFPAGRNALTAEQFHSLKATIDERTPKQVQAYAVAWAAPYRVDCMSLTSALAFGFDEKYCAQQCAPTEPSPYFNSTSRYPFGDYRMRPAMMLAGTTFEQVKALIDRGIRSDRSFPNGRIYLLSTSDKARNSRAAGFAHMAQEMNNVLPVQILEADFITGHNDVLGYFTGSAEVARLDTLGFQPGALADHLTSAGGMLTDSHQMSSLRWLEAGATASYGAVVEPCNFPQKFPAPGVMMFHYTLGATAIEAYWKSVAWPGQGVFVGEPLAKPFAPLLREQSADIYELKLFSPRADRLRIEKSASAAGPFKPLPQQQAIQRGANTFVFRLTKPHRGYLRLLWD